MPITTSINQRFCCIERRLAKVETTLNIFIAGNPFLGETLTAVGGGPDYTWLRNGAPIEGATGSTYVVQVEDIGQSITVASVAGISDPVVGSFPGLITALNADANIILGAGTDVSEWRTISGTSGLYSNDSPTSPQLTAGRVVTVAASAQQMGEQLIQTDSTVLPDAFGSTPGKGFTCTGIAFDPTDGTYWISNDGRIVESNPVAYHASIIHVTAEGAKLGEIDVLAVRPAAQSLQGICIDGQGTLWVASVAENLLLNFSKSGTYIKSYAVDAQPNGLAYDAGNNLLIVLQGTAPYAGKTYNATTGAAVGTIPSGSSDWDQIQWLPGGQIFGTRGGNGVSGIVMRVSPGGSDWEDVLTVKGALAVEGLDVGGSRFKIASDEYFHAVGTDLNRLIDYPRRPISGVAVVDIVICWKRNAVPGQTAPFLCFGESLSHPGVALYATTTGTSANEVQVAVNTAVGSTNRDFTVVTTGDITALNVIRVRVDLVARTAKVWRNGVLITTLNLVNSGSTVALGKLTIGGIPSRRISADYASIWAAVDVSEANMTAVEAYVRAKYGV